MIRATRVLPPDERPATVADRVVLDYDDRYRRRMVLTGADGLAFLLDLPEAASLRDGDALLLEDGRAVLVSAAAEALAEIEAEDAAHLVRIAWHLGNRHLPTQLLGERLRIRRDHVIEAMVEGLGARVTHIEAPFDPEGGAYGKGRTHGHHDHHHGHGHDHHHGHHHHGHDHD